MRIVENFNQGWYFIPEQVERDLPDDRFEAITLPHTNKVFSQRFVDNSEYQFVSTYRKRFSLPENSDGSRVFLDFDGVMLACTIYLNGVLLGVHKGGYTPFSFEITHHLNSDDNELVVYVDSREQRDIPPYGELVDYLTFGGIYRDVYLRIVHPCHIVDAFVRPFDVLTAPGLACDVQLSQVAAGLSIRASLADGQGRMVAEQVQTIAAESATVMLSGLESITLWSLENPALYTLHLELSQQGEPVDQVQVRFGFRHAEFCKDGRFYLNGEPLNLFGLNRHQTYPYIGAAAPARLQWLDAEILKYELGCNVVRTSHYPQSPHFLDRCDEIGLLVFEEIVGWQHIGDQAWQDLLVQQLAAMIKRDRNHPSLILWGVRVNESPDHDALYTRTNALAHQLDPTRQTGGVRNRINSKMLEDVFTFNDFLEGIREPVACPHLITEFGGHMFPTKAWDPEERRLEQALKHARKHDRQIGHPGVAGAIGWCAFDYHTHQEFGSGDRICHHGVMDIFRLPKMAAYFYRSQRSPADEIVLYAATSWTLGDRAGGGNNPLVVFSNCEEIEVLTGQVSHGFFQPDRVEFPHLKHPPFSMHWPEPYNPWGTASHDLTVRGYIHQQVVAEHKIACDHKPCGLRLASNTQQLQADGTDMARITVQIVDRYGNVLPYQLGLVNFTLEGDAELIGENPLALLGGQGACYLKAHQTPGGVTISARAVALPEVSIAIQVSC